MALDTGNIIINSNTGTVVDGKDVSGGYFVTASLDIIPPYSNINGAICLNKSDNKFYKYDGNNWVEFNIAVSTDISSAVSAHNSSNSAHSDIRGSVSAIEEKIPTQATSGNQLADKNFVNSTVTSLAAFYVTSNTTGEAFSTKAALLSGPYYNQGSVYTPTRNDYALVLTDADHSNLSSRYLFDGTNWTFQYTLNNTAFTAAQLAAINSGITDTAVAQIATNTSAIENKQDTIDDLETIRSGAELGSTSIQPNDDISELNNDSGYITKSVNDLTNYTKTSDLGALATKDSVNYETEVTNKPTIPTVNDGTITITQGGVQKGSFTVNQSGDTTISLDNGGSDIDNTSITKNTDDEIQTIGVIDQKTGNVNKQWTGTQAEYDALEEIDENTFYTITDVEMQEKLISGENIKTINSQSILGAGNIEVGGGTAATIEANPTLSGNEKFLSGLKVGDTKYSTKPDLSGKVISIMGDSISTYAGWIPNSAGVNDGTGTLMHAIFYPNHGSYVNNVNMTWWYKLIFNKFKAKLGVNESWSGSFVGNNKDTNSATTTSCHAPGNDTGPDTCMAGNTRIKRLAANGTPDIIYVYGGTNDISQPGTPGESLGSFNNATDYSTIDLSSTKWSTFVDAYRTMIQRMQYYYPNAKIIALLPAYCVSYYNRAKLEEWTEQIKLICDYFGVNYIDLRACGITWANSASSRNAKGIQTLGDSNIHPNALGHTMIADYVEAETYKILNQDFKENIVYTVTNALTNLVNTKSYITGVSKNEAYNATMTGSNLTICKVYMNNVDITSSAYNSSTGVININNVTGNILINEGAPIVIPVTGVGLNASSKSIMIGDVETLTASIVPNNATNKNVTWSKNNNNVTLTPNGLSCTVTGANNGSSVVTVTTEDGSFTSSCNFTIHQIALTSIEVVTPPSKTAYHYGETFSTIGLQIRANYDDGTNEILDSSDYTYTPSRALTDSDTTITFSYTYNGVTKTATQSITVATLDSIEVTAQPSKITYAVGESFNPAGMIVTATWSDESTSTVTGYTYSPTTALTLEDTEITISYTVGGVTETTTQAITVEEATEWWGTDVATTNGWTADKAVSISITTAGDFAYTGTDVMALYQGHTINYVRCVPKVAGTVTVRVYNYSPDIVGRKDTISLRTGDTATFTITSDMLDNQYHEIPLSNELYIGENQFWTIGTAGDTGLFGYGSMVSASDSYRMFNNIGTSYAVNIQTFGLFTDMGYKISTEPTKTLSSISITTPPTKTEYVEGETFNTAGMVVTATYDDDTTAVVTGYTYSPNTALTTSDTTITISYTENNITKTATQAITVSEAEIQYHTNNIDLPLNAEAKPSFAAFVNYSDNTFFEGKIIKSVRFKPYKAGTLTVGLVQVANWSSASSIASTVTITVNPDDVDVVTEYPLNLPCGTGYAPYVMLTTDTATFWYSETGGNGFKNQVARDRTVGESIGCNLGVDFGYIE